MRLLIGNDLDDSLLYKVDIRAWAHRLLWFAQDHDILIMMDEPDPDHVKFVTKLTGVDSSTLKFLILPEGGRFGRRMFDHQLLLDQRFLAIARAELGAVTEVHALWHSPLIQVFLARLGLAKVWPGGTLYLQNGAECLNSMGNFRAFAIAAGVPIADGTVCRTKEDAEFLSRELLARYPALMVKKAHAGAGAGNLLLTNDTSIEGACSGNARRVALSTAEGDSLRVFWEEYWDWASSQGRYPVVIERYVRDARSVYVEFFLDEDGSHVREVGELHFESSRLSREVVPARSISDHLRTPLVASAQRLADFYHALGHRGFLSADSVVDAQDEFTFTEINAQFTGSSHLYSVVSNQVVRARERGLQVTQLTSPQEWNLSGIRELLDVLEASGFGFKPDSVECVIPITPCIGDRGLLIMAVVQPAGEDTKQVLDRLASGLAEARD